MNPRQSRHGKRISKQQEKRAAADLGGRTTAASGAAKFSGGADVRVMGKIRLECKITEKYSFTLKWTELEKLRKQAIKVLEQPVLQFAFRRNTGKVFRYAVISWIEPHLNGFTYWSSEFKSGSLAQSDLDYTLSKGPIKIEFLASDINPAHSKFEIMHWDDFVEWHKRNA